MEVKSNHECCGLSYNREHETILSWIGLVKHPQVMSCIYITLFLVTMLIISQQVMAMFPSLSLSLFRFFPLFTPHIPNRQTENILTDYQESCASTYSRSNNSSQITCWHVVNL